MKWFSRITSNVSSGRKALAPRIVLTNTLSGTKELFIPVKPGLALMYTCGPTVYGKQHIGNLRPALTSDTLARTLTAANYRVRRVINITDVGHLTDDGDQGEDKMAIGAAREQTSPEEIAERYAALFIDDLTELAVDTGDIRFPRASEYIREQIALASSLEENGFAYRIPDGLYFDTRRFPNYGALGNLAGATLVAGARIAQAPGKHHPHDFALWRRAKPGDLQQWDSPWGRGNPGWHLECSAMIRSLLGEQIDIHAGGEDLAMIHHNDEIAQSEAAHGRPFVRYWVHNAFLTMAGEKVSKSLGNVVYLSDITAKGFHPLALRYFYLQAHYRTPVAFSWGALAAASSALERLWRVAHDVREESGGAVAPSEARDRFIAFMREDLATPQALGELWEVLRSDEYTPEEKQGLIEDADVHLGLSLTDPPTHTIALLEVPEGIQVLMNKREAARAKKDFDEADRLRREIENRGYRVEDHAEGPILTKAP